MSSASPGPEFTVEHPLLVNVGLIDDQWDIQPSTTDRFPLDRKLYSEKMLERVRKIPGGRPSLMETFERRRVKGGLKIPKFIEVDGHIPIVLRPWEYVRFQCDHPFFISSGRDQNVFPDAKSPDSPFLWPASQESTKPPYFVIGVSQRELHHQRFYKCVGWVKVGRERHLIDPDTVGTTDGGS
jgi:hypothetical protein